VSRVRALWFLGSTNTCLLGGSPARSACLRTTAATQSRTHTHTHTRAHAHAHTHTHTHRHCNVVATSIRGKCQVSCTSRFSGVTKRVFIQRVEIRVLCLSVQRVSVVGHLVQEKLLVVFDCKAWTRIPFIAAHFACAGDLQPNVERDDSGESGHTLHDHVWSLKLKHVVVTLQAFQSDFVCSQRGVLQAPGLHSQAYTQIHENEKPFNHLCSMPMPFREVHAGIGPPSMACCK
jgi:hypothetical protein